MPVLENQRHELFAQEVAKGASADEAFVLAGFRKNRGNASTLRARPEVRARIDEILGAAAVETICTIQDIARQLDEDRTFARECEAPAAAISATMGKAKVLGLMVEKHEHSGPDGGPITVVDRSPRDLAKDIFFVLAKALKSPE